MCMLTQLFHSNRTVPPHYLKFQSLGSTPTTPATFPITVLLCLYFLSVLQIHCVNVFCIEISCLHMAIIVSFWSVCNAGRFFFVFNSAHWTDHLTASDYCLQSH